MTEKPSQVPETSKNPEIQKPMYPLNFDFATTKGAQEGVAMQNKVRMAWDQLNLAGRNVRLDEKTKDVAVSMYEGSTGERFIQVAINDKDGTVQKAWLTAGGAILLHEPVDGIAAEDIARTLASKK